MQGVLEASYTLTTKQCATNQDPTVKRVAWIGCAEGTTIDFEVKINWGSFCSTF